MTRFSHLWGCEWTPSKAAFWHLLVVKTIWDARGGYRFRSAANARHANASILLGDTYLHFQEECHVVLLRPHSHQVLQYHLIMRFFSSRLIFEQNPTPRRREEKSAYSSFQIYQLLLILHFFPFRSFRKKLIWLEQKRTKILCKTLEKEKKNSLVFFRS